MPETGVTGNSIRILKLYTPNKSFTSRIPTLIEPLSPVPPLSQTNPAYQPLCLLLSLVLTMAFHLASLDDKSDKELYNMLIYQQIIINRTSVSQARVLNI